MFCIERVKMYHNYLDLIEYLQKYAEENNIVCIWCDTCPDYIPCSSTDDLVIFMNINWKYPMQIPFALGHEVGHIIHGDYHSYEKSIQAKRQEEAADLYSLGLISGYCLKHKIDIKTCGIPISLLL
jgi:hypothetical protein